MQRLAGVAVNDGALLAWFARHYAEALDVRDAGPRGHWGLGFEGQGEVLVKKAPLGGPLSAQGVLEGLRARHVVVAADGAPAARRSLEDSQPLRYRDWLCAASGTHSLDAAFVSRVQASSAVSDFAAARNASPEEALLMVFVDTLYRGLAREPRKLPVAALREALAEAAARLRALLAPASPDLAVLLYGHEQLFALPLGRPMVLARLGPSDHARADRAGAGRGAEHLRAVVVSDRQLGPYRWEVLTSAVRIGPAAEVEPFAV